MDITFDDGRGVSIDLVDGVAYWYPVHEWCLDEAMNHYHKDVIADWITNQTFHEKVQDFFGCADAAVVPVSPMADVKAELDTSVKVEAIIDDLHKPSCVEKMQMCCGCKTAHQKRQEARRDRAPVTIEQDLPPQAPSCAETAFSPCEPVTINAEPELSVKQEAPAAPRKKFSEPRPKKFPLCCCKAPVVLEDTDPDVIEPEPDTWTETVADFFGVGSEEGSEEDKPSVIESEKVDEDCVQVMCSTEPKPSSVHSSDSEVFDFVEKLDPPKVETPEVKVEEVKVKVEAPEVKVKVEAPAAPRKKIRFS